MKQNDKERPLISVIVPIHNMENYLSKCVASVMAQTYQHFELILVDDGSTDASGALCDGYAAQDARVRVIHRENGGISAARNAGLDAAQGEYLAQIDSDDWVSPTYLETLLSLCLRNNVPLSACNHYIVGETGHSLRFSIKMADREMVLSAEDGCRNVLYHGIPDVSGWGKLYHRSVYEKIRYPQGQIYEDTHTIADVLLAAKRFAFTPQPLYYYRIRKDSISRDVFKPAKMDFLRAVDHMTSVIVAAYPQMEAGIRRRRMHAALSTRRYFVDCSEDMLPLRKEVETIVRQDACSVLLDGRAALRDKIGVLCMLCGAPVYDIFWKIYCRMPQK